MAYLALTQTIKAERTTIMVAGKEVEVFRMPNGEYRYSQVSVSAAIGKKQSDFSNYQRSLKASDATSLTPVLGGDAVLESLQGNGSDGTSSNGKQLLVVGRTRVSGLTEEYSANYWAWKAKNGCLEAEAMLVALATEALRRRADSAFGVKVSEAAYEARTEAVRVARYLELKGTIQAMIDSGTSSFSDTLTPLRTERDDIYYSLTPLEKEVLLERNLDITDPDWRDDCGADDMVTDKAGNLDLTDRQKAYYQV